MAPHTTTSLLAPTVGSSQSASLQIPSMDPSSGSSRHQASSSNAPNASRPVSVAVHSSATQNPPSASASSRRQQRASHQVVSPSAHAQASSNNNNQEDVTPYTDVYSHPAAVAYAAAHPRRVIPKFGPYLLLQTLGEGEFGKVKLGLHGSWGEEVAVKLIRRGNVDTSVRMSKVEREIEVLRTLKHPNIVRLYDVIETDKYIGIILEYASGGELFDHILAHRYLRERDAAKLFSQLISGVWYIHQKKIVHRDLKLENLLLDRHRNVIITDFGFANRFEHKADDLMQTSCGSPCYAAPELVISEGLYVGSAVDIWSCGVILYAMLAGYLPFDDDPANPDGDNINLLYKYIVNTPLSFPEYISEEARDLLGMMLVPDPTNRASLDAVMRHSWLSQYAIERTDGSLHAFGKTVAELETAAMEQHNQKRLAYQKQMRAAQNQPSNLTPNARTQSHRPELSGHSPHVAGRSRSTQADVVYDSSIDQSMTSPGVASVNTTPTHGPRKAYGSPTALGLSDDDPFAAPGGVPTNAEAHTTANNSGKQRTSEDRSRAPNAPSHTEASGSPQKGHRQSNSGGGGFRHTIQVEYDEPKSAGGSGRRSEDKKRERTASQSQKSPISAIQPPPEMKPETQGKPNPLDGPSSPSPQTPRADRRVSVTAKPLPPSPATPTSYRSPSTTRNNYATSPTSGRSESNKVRATQLDMPTVNVLSPPDAAMAASPISVADDKDSGSQKSTSSVKKGHKKGRSSIDKLGFGKLFGSGNGPAPPVPLSPEPNNSAAPSDSSASVMLSPVVGEKEGRKSRRNTLTVMVEPLRTIRNRAGKGRTATTPHPDSAASIDSREKKKPAPQSAVLPRTGVEGQPSMAGDLEGSGLLGMQASTSKARKVMQWFRTKSKGHDVGTSEEEDKGAVTDEERKGFTASNATLDRSREKSKPSVPTVVTTPATAIGRGAPLSAVAAPGHPSRTPSSATDASYVNTSLVSRFRNSVTVGSNNVPPKHPHSQLRIHHGAVDQTTITTRPPPEVMKHVREVLTGMGVEISVESEYKYRCVRVKKRKSPVVPSGGTAQPTGLAAVTMVGTAGSNGVDKRGLPLPSPSAFSSTGGMLRGLLMRRQSSQVSTGGLAFDDETSVIINEPGKDATYGDPNQDAQDEVRFSVELTRLDRLNDTFSLDIRRLKGNLRSYKFLYDTLRERADLQR